MLLKVSNLFLELDFVLLLRSLVSCQSICCFVHLWRLYTKLKLCPRIIIRWATVLLRKWIIFQCLLFNDHIKVLVGEYGNLSKGLPSDYLRCVLHNIFDFFRCSRYIPKEIDDKWWKASFPNYGLELFKCNGLLNFTLSLFHVVGYVMFP